MASNRTPTTAAAWPGALIALAVLLSACTSAAGAGIRGTTQPAATAPAASVPAAAMPSPADDPTVFALPDLTGRPISITDLTAMLPAGSDGDPSVRTNEALVTAAVLDRADEAADIQRSGRATGVAAAYRDGNATNYVWIDLLDGPEGAAAWVSDTAGDVVKRLGGTHRAAIDVAAATEFPIEAGQGAIGLVVGHAGGETETAVFYRLGRIAVFVSVVRDDDADQRVAAQYLAEGVADRILDVLAGTSPDPPAAGGPASFEFQSERTVRIGDETWTTTAEGSVAGDAVDCTVSLELPTLESTRRLISAGGRLWVAEGRETPQERGTAGSLDRTMLAMCPAWPVEISTAGLEGLAAGAAAEHEIAGVPALGYNGDAAALAASVGLDPETITVDVLNVWVMEGTSWVVGLDLTVSGIAADLAQLIGTGYPAGESASVTLTQQVTAIESTAPVIPPG